MGATEFHGLFAVFGAEKVADKTFGGNFQLNREAVNFGSEKTPHDQTRNRNDQAKGGVVQSDIYVNSAKYWHDNGGNSRWEGGGRIIRCFSHDNVNDVRGMVKALWMNGAWQFTGGEDQGGLP